MSRSFISILLNCKQGDLIYKAVGLWFKKAQQRVEEAERRAEQLAAQLKALRIDPNQLQS